MAASASPSSGDAENACNAFSLTHAASLLGVHRNTLAGWLEKGCPSLRRADRSRGIEWELSVADIVEWRISRAVSDAVAGYQDESGNISKDEADRRRAVALAITAEVSADEALKAVVYRHEAEADVAAFCQVLRTGLGNASSKIAARAAAMANAPEIEDLCHAELNRAFAAARGELAERWLRERAEPGAHGTD